MLEKQLQHLVPLYLDGSQGIEVVLIDDGSPDKPLEARLRHHRGPYQNLRAFRVIGDLPWNHRVARNIGALESRGEWLLLIDIDTLVPRATIEEILRAELVGGRYYLFNRVENKTGRKLPTHHDSLLIKRSDYWKAGGYDSRFSGIYGAAGRFLRDLEWRGVKNAHLDLDIRRVESSEIPDATTEGLSRKNSFRQRWFVRSVFHTARAGVIAWRRPINTQYQPVGEEDMKFAESDKEP